MPVGERPPLDAAARSQLEPLTLLQVLPEATDQLASLRPTASISQKAVDRSLHEPSERRFVHGADVQLRESLHAALHQEVMKRIVNLGRGPARIARRRWDPPSANDGAQRPSDDGQVLRAHLAGLVELVERALVHDRNGIDLSAASAARGSAEADG